MSIECSYFFSFFSDYMPHFLWWPFPYIILHPSIPSLPLVDFVGNPSDACPIKTSWKFCEHLWTEMTLFECHFSINAASSFGAVHLMWWWQPSSQIFLLLLLTYLCYLPWSLSFKNGCLPKALPRWLGSLGITTDPSFSSLILDPLT